MHKTNLYKIKNIQKPEFLKKCIVRKYKGDNKKGSIIFMHGFTSIPQMQTPLAKEYGELGYDTYQCPLRGHGIGKNKNIGSKMDWHDSLNDLDNLVEYLHKKNKNDQIILMGQSLGATLVISEANKNKHIDKAFAFGGLNSKQMILENQDYYSKIFKKAGVNFKKYDPDDVQFTDVLPHDLNKCLTTNKKRIYLIHSRMDNVVPFSEMEKNKKELCLPEENTLIYDWYETITRPKFLHTAHVMPIYKKKSKRWVKNKLKETKKLNTINKKEKELKDIIHKNNKNKLKFEQWINEIFTTK